MSKQVGRPRQYPERRLDIQLRDDQWARLDWLTEEFDLTQRDVIRWFVDEGIRAVALAHEKFEERRAKIMDGAV